MADLRLSPSSYIVLGLLCGAGEGTAYDLKQMVSISIGNFWQVPHGQIYAEAKRLASAGLLAERAESDGRRRRVYRPTAAGRRAFERWLEEPPEAKRQLRDPGLLKLFLGATPRAIAVSELASHQARLATYEELYANVAEHCPEGQRLALESGIAHEREFVRFWRALID